MARKGENIRKRKDGRYEARYKSGFNENGDPVYKSVYGRTYSEAKNNRLKFIAEGGCRYDAGKTIKDISMKWLELKKIEVKCSTYAKYYDIVKNHIIISFGGIAISKTIKNIVSVLKQILKFAGKQYNNSNLNFDYIIPKDEFAELQVLDREEQLRLSNYLLSNKTRKNLGLLICLNTGMRIGKICALRHGDINNSKLCICVRRTMQRIKNIEAQAGPKTIINIDEPKSKTSVRDIPIKKTAYR